MVNAIDTLRAQHLARDSASGKPRPDNCETCAALAKLETLLQAAERVERNLGQEKADGGGERDAAYYALAAAVRDVKGQS